MKKEKVKDGVSREGDGWFYSDTVKEHFFKPKNFMDECKVKNYKADGVGIVGSSACGDVMKVWIKVDKKSNRIKDLKWMTFGSLISGAKLIMNDFNLKNVENLKVGDKILDGEGKENIVEENLVRDYEGEVLSIGLSTSKYYNFILTKNHPIPCVRRKNVASVNRFSENRWSEVSAKKIEKAPIELLSASELKSGDFMIFQVPNDIKDIKELDEDICTLLGYYVSDGSTPSKNRIIFYFGMNEMEFVDEIEKIAKRRKFSYKIYKRNTENVICFQLNESEIAKILVEHGGKPSHKKFSMDVMRLPFKKQEKIIDAYINGDGWVTQQNENWQKQYFISTSKEELAHQLQFMIGRLGIFAPIHKREIREFRRRGKIYKNSGEFDIVFRKDTRCSRIKYQKKTNSFLIPISKINIINYKGKIYDPGLLYEPKTYRVNGISLHNCASAIASTSVMSEMVVENGGMTIENAMKLTPQDILKRLDGLPSIKVHCSVLGDKALRAAIADYQKKKK